MQFAAVLLRQQQQQQLQARFLWRLPSRRHGSSWIGAVLSSSNSSRLETASSSRTTTSSHSFSSKNNGTINSNGEANALLRKQRGSTPTRHNQITTRQGSSWIGATLSSSTDSSTTPSSHSKNTNSEGTTNSRNQNLEGNTLLRKQRVSSATRHRQTATRQGSSWIGASLSSSTTNTTGKRFETLPSSNSSHSFSSNSEGSSLTTTSTSSTPATITSKDGVVGTPIDFDIASKIEGNESQILTVQLEPGQVLRAESGAMMYMTTGVEMQSTTGGGLSTGFQRMLTGQNFFISDYTYTGEPGTTGTVALGTDFPSKIMRLNIPEYGGKIVCQKGALLCATHTVDINMEYSKNFSTGFFGGEGFILQGLTGDGDVFVKAGGTLIRRDLREGEQLRISSGCLVAFSNGVDYDVQMVKGFTNVLAGGEGLFMTTLTGPGVVWLQGQPAQRMISEIVRRVPSGGGIGLAVPIGGGGGGGESGGEGGSEGGQQGS